MAYLNKFDWLEFREFGSKDKFYKLVELADEN